MKSIQFCLLLLFTAVFNFSFAQNYDEVTDSDYDTKIVMKDGLYGVIDDDGDVIIPLEFTSIETDVFGFKVYKSNGKFEFRHSNGRKYDLGEYNKAWDLSEGFRIAMYVSDLDIEKYGFISESGVRLTAFKYNDAFDFENGWAIVVVYGKRGAINTSGETIVPAVYKSISLDAIGFRATKPNDEVDIYDWRGNNMNSVSLTNYWNPKENRAVFQIGDKYGYLDGDGKIVVDAKYDDAWNYVNGEGTVLLDGLEGKIDLDGNVRWDKTSASTTASTSNTSTASNNSSTPKFEYTPRSGEVGISIDEENCAYKKSETYYSAEKMIAHGSSIYIAGQAYANSAKPGVIVKYNGLNGRASDIQQAKELISEEVTRYGSNLKFRDVYVQGTDVVAGGGESIVVFDESNSMSVKKELSVSGLIVSKIASGGDGICVAMAVKEFKDVFNGSGKDERDLDCMELHLIIWNYKTNKKVTKSLIPSEVWKYFGLVTLDDNTVVISYSAMAFNREGAHSLYPKHTGSVNVIAKIDPKGSLAAGSVQIKKSLILTESQGYNYEDMIVDRNGDFAIAMRNGGGTGIVKVDADLENYLAYAYGDYNEKTNPRYFEFQGEYQYSYEGDDISRAYIIEDPSSDGYIINHRLSGNTDASLIAEDYDKIFMSQPFYLYVNSEDLTEDSWDFVNISVDRSHASNHYSGASFRNYSTFKSSIFHEESGFFIMLEEFRDHKQELNPRMGHYVEMANNVWLIRPSFDR